MESQHLKAYMARTVTGGPWHDHGIGYVSFAGEELLLFLAINDVSHFEESRQYGQRIWDACTQSLAGYPPFQGLSAEQIYNVQLKWWMLAHGFAFHARYAPPGSVGIDKRPEALAWRQKTADSGEPIKPETLIDNHRFITMIGIAPRSAWRYPNAHIQTRSRRTDE